MVFSSWQTKKSSFLLLSRNASSRTTAPHPISSSTWCSWCVFYCSASRMFIHNVTQRLTWKQWWSILTKSGQNQVSIRCSIYDCCLLKLSASQDSVFYLHCVELLILYLRFADNSYWQLFAWWFAIFSTVPCALCITGKKATKHSPTTIVVSKQQKTVHQAVASDSTVVNFVTKAHKIDCVILTSTANAQFFNRWVCVVVVFVAFCKYRMMWMCF